MSPTAPMRILIGIAMLALASCAQPTDGEGDGEASCPAILRYAGTEYGQEQAGQELDRSELLGKGALPGCADTNKEAPADEEVDVWSLKGVDPGVAIGVKEGGTLALYVANGVKDVCSVKYTKCED